MSPDLDRLIQLQHLDSTIDHARRTMAAHPQRLADADARLQDARQTVDAARQRLKDNQDARRALDKDVALYQGRLSKYKDQQAAVKTNKEYQALGHEIETAQKELGGVEEKILERMMEADTLAVDIKTTEGVLAAQQKEIDAEKKAMAAELAAVEASMKEATERRAALLGQLDKRLIALYEQVGKARKGIAICMATRDGLCSVCHVRLRPQVFQLIRQNDSIIQCDSCQRILYYHPPPPPVEHPVTHRS
jgi:predicted  nucleic acid-binding Zn-ribbon protein